MSEEHQAAHVHRAESTYTAAPRLDLRIAPLPAPMRRRHVPSRRRLGASTNLTSFDWDSISLSISSFMSYEYDALVVVSYESAARVFGSMGELQSHPAAGVLSGDTCEP